MVNEVGLTWISSQQQVIRAYCSNIYCDLGCGVTCRLQDFHITFFIFLHQQQGRRHIMDSNKFWREILVFSPICIHSKCFVTAFLVLHMQPRKIMLGTISQQVLSLHVLCFGLIKTVNLKIMKYSTNNIFCMIRMKTMVQSKVLLT